MKTFHTVYSSYEVIQSKVIYKIPIIIPYASIQYVLHSVQYTICTLTVYYISNDTPIPFFLGNHIFPLVRNYLEVWNTL